ncbi:hypothetical protein BDFB_002779 [Asbolus verrucosus]|uniref:Uncharacterized protein n=1 Tax=Asbolus verrucosus TaxID=1661398 RepID=A0A482W1Z9_ASBVE|nr:hypothetical protein BDFB_002779 [Asbolus verrucosus]
MSYRPHLVLLLTALHRQQHLDWCRERLQWNLQRRQVVFGDKSRFCLEMLDRRMRLKSMCTIPWEQWYGVLLLVAIGHL